VQGQPLSHGQRLAERLDRLNLQVYEMAGDGNWQVDVMLRFLHESKMRLSFVCLSNNQTFNFRAGKWLHCPRLFLHVCMLR